MSQIIFPLQYLYAEVLCLSSIHAVYSIVVVSKSLFSKHGEIRGVKISQIFRLSFLGSSGNSRLFFRNYTACVDVSNVVMTKRYNFSLNKRCDGVVICYLFMSKKNFVPRIKKYF